MLIFTIFLFYFGTGDSLIVFDITYTATKKYGKAEVSAYLLEVDIFYEYKGSLEGCDILYVSEYVRCDILIFTRLCMAIVKDDSHHPYEFNDEHTFKVNELMNVTTLDRPNLRCGPVKSTFLEEQRNSFKAINEQDVKVNFISDEYSNLLVFTAITGDFLWGYYQLKRPDFGEYARNTMGIKTIIQKNVNLRWTQYVYYFNSTMLHEYLIIARCSDKYFGRTCWFKCEDNARQLCNCVYQETYSNVPCNPQCMPGWIGSYAVYNFGEINEGLRICTMIDVCATKTSCQYTCLPFTNTSSLCEKIYTFIRSSIHPTNLTSEVLLLEEFITVSIDHDSLIKKDIATNTTISFNKTDPIFTDKVLVYMHGDKNAVFVVEGFDKIDEAYNFSFNINLGAWEKEIHMIKTFRVYIKPQDLFIYHLEGMEPVTTLIFLGETLFSNSTGRPVYRTIFHWSGIGIIFKFPVSEKVIIKDNTELRLVSITINVTLIISKRPNEVFSKTLKAFVKPFVYFEWSSQNNVFESTVSIECRYKAYITVHIAIFQMQGPSNLNTVRKPIKFIDAKGGEYELLCFFTTNIGLQYMRRIVFQLRTYPSFICLFLFANTLGSIVQCGHSGSIYDEYEIKVDMLALEYDWTIKAEGQDYIRIPYYLESAAYLIKCNISNKINRSKQNYFEMRKKFSGALEAMYTLTTQFKQCPEYADFVEKPLVSAYYHDSVLLIHVIFDFIISDSQINSFMALSLFYMLLLYILTFLSIKFFAGSGEDKRALARRVKASYRHMKRRDLNDKLHEESKKRYGKSNEALEKYFNINFDKIRNSSRFLGSRTF